MSWFFRCKAGRALSSPTRDQTRTPLALEGGVPTAGSPESPWAQLSSSLQAPQASAGRLGCPHLCPRARRHLWAPHLIVLLQQHRVGEALVQAQRCELPAGAPDVQNQVRAGHVAQDVQEDLIGEAQQVGAVCHRGCHGGCVAVIARVLKIRGTKFPWDPQGRPSAKGSPYHGPWRGAVTKTLNYRARAPDILQKPPFQSTHQDLFKHNSRSEISNFFF